VAVESMGSDDGAVAQRTGSRAGRNLPAAIGVGLALGGLIIATLLVYEPLFLVVVAAAVAVALWELSRAMSVRGIETPGGLMILGSTGMLAGAFYGGSRALAAVFAGTALVAILWRMRRGQAGFVQDVTSTVFCLVYAPFLASFVALLLVGDHGAERVLTFIIVTVASDTGGYAVGATLGRHPMAPRISPRKSWEGFAGSVLACMIAGVLCVTLMLDGVWWVGLVLGVVAAAAATFGDLAESLIKRDLGIKDMSNLLPGHGGMLDRLDSLLATAPLVWVVLRFLLPAV
jgi:phosphatidate cytidylyltransferase